MAFDRLELKGSEVSCCRGGRLVLDRRSFACAPGAPLVVRGANGAGKSTLLRLLAGMIQPMAGRLEWRVGAAAEPRLDPELIHYVGHLEGLKPALSVRANLDFWAAYLGASDSLAAGLAAFALEDLADIPVHVLSAGQRKRAALARLLVARRPVWLLDEPVVSLDDTSRRLLERMLDAHVADGGLLVVATHDPLSVAHAVELMLPLTPARPGP